MEASGWQVYTLRHGVAQLLLWSAFYYLLPALLPLLQADGIASEPVSMAISGALALWALALPLAGNLVDRGHGLVLMRAGGALGVALMLLALVLPPPFGLVPIVLLGPAMAATLYDPCFAILLRTPGLDANKAITEVTLIAGMATVVTYPLVSGLSQVLEWPVVVLVFAGAGLAGVALLPSQGDTKPEAAPVARPAVRHAERLYSTWLVALPFGLGIFSHAVLLFVLPLALIERGWDTALALLLPAMLGPAQVAGRLLWRLIAPRASVEVSVVTMFSLAMITPAALLASGGNWWIIVSAMALQGGLHGINTVLRPLSARNVLPVETIGRSLGIIAMIGILCMAAAPMAGGLVYARIGFGGLVGLVAGANLIALMASIALAGLSRGRFAWTGS